MSELNLPKSVISIIQTRKQIEETIRDVVATNLRLTGYNTPIKKSVDISKPTTLDSNDIIGKIKVKIEGLEISEELLILKVFKEIVLRIIDEYKISPKKFNTLIVLCNPKDSEAYFNKLTEIGSKLGFPDMTENIKERILFGVLDLTRSNLKNTDHAKNVWAKVITIEQYQQINFDESTILIK